MASAYLTHCTDLPSNKAPAAEAAASVAHNTKRLILIKDRHLDESINVNDLLVALQRIAMTRKDDMARGAECALELRTIARAAVVAAIGENKAMKCYQGLFGIVECSDCAGYQD